LEGLVPFAKGDSWRDEVLGSFRQALLDYFSKRGFYQAKVGVTPFEEADGNIIIKIQVDEGKPCVIKSFWIDDPPGFKSQHVMLRFKSKIQDVARMRAGDRYDEQTLGDRVRELREWLVDEDFILANTDRVRLKFNDDKTEVDVVLAVEYGDRVTFGFQDNTAFTQADLNEFIAQVRATGLGKDYVGVIQRRFADAYHARAFNNVKIDTIFSERPLSKHVTFKFTEGSRTLLQEMKWEGLIEPNALMAANVFEGGSSRLVQRGFFVEKDIDKAILLVLEDLKSRGYLTSKLIAKSIQPIKSPSGMQRVRVVIQIAEGEQTLVGRNELLGFSYFPVDRIRSTLGLTEEKPFNPFSFEEGLQRLRALYVTEGFLDFRILTPEDDIVSFSENNRDANVRVRVTEGKRVKIGKIRIEGLKKTREYVVSRELLVHEGDWWLGPDLQQTEVNIRKLGLFSDVRVIPSPSLQGPDYRDLVLELKEVEPGSFEVGPGYRSDLGIRAFSRLSYNNILGKNWIGSLGAEANRRTNSDYHFVEYKFDTSFVEPRFFGTHNLYSIGMSTRKESFPPDFNAVTTQFVTGFERKLIPAVTARLFYKLERIRQFDVFINNQPSPDDDRSMLIGSIVPSLTLDTRDNPFTATSGWLATGQLEYAHPLLSNQSASNDYAPAYQKWTASVHRYTPLTKDIVWSTVASGGFERSDIAGREIPLVKLFRLGGSSTIRGFPEDAINVDTFHINGTLASINFRSQVDLPLVGELKFAPFVDAGNLFINNVFRGNPFFRVGAGVGLHYMTPVGPINLDWGRKLNPIGGEAPNQIHFSVGLI
ncbi:MAG: BamA/TamA family outer membrane protein, partial [Deltaproteobacteria bacterium]|nr:BamA/TamA family outer membrane protein [Deltaproteobacteria bacterium]